MGMCFTWMQTGSGDCARKDNQGEYRTDLLNPVVVSHYRARAVLGFLQLEATETLPMAVDPLSYFSFQSVLHDWCNKGRGMCYPVSGMVHIKEPLLLIGKSSPCGGSGFPLSLSEWSFTITPNQIPLTTIVTYLEKSYRSRISKNWAIIPAISVVPPIYKQSEKTYCHISF